MVPKILLVDDHAVVRRGLRQMLAEEYPRAQFGEAVDGNEALSLLDSRAWDLVLLDVSMPRLSGLDVLKQIRQTLPRTPVLALSCHPESLYGIRTLRSGASGYITKDSAPEVLTRAVKKVLGGGKYVSPALAERLAEEVAARDDRPPHHSLSNREYEILRLLGAGKRVTEIATELSLSPKTVGTYRTRILEKMRMKTNAQLMRYALDHGLVE